MASAGCNAHPQWTPLLLQPIRAPALATQAFHVCVHLWPISLDLTLWLMNIWMEVPRVSTRILQRGWPYTVQMDQFQAQLLELLLLALLALLLPSPICLRVALLALLHCSPIRLLPVLLLVLQLALLGQIRLLLATLLRSLLLVE